MPVIRDAIAAAEQEALRRVDRRSLLRKKPTETLSTKVRRETIDTIQRIANTEGIAMVDVIERAIDSYERMKGGR